MLTKEDNELLCRVERDAPMGQLMRRHWLPVCLSEEVAERDGTPVRARLLGEDLVVFRDTSGQARRARRILPAPARVARLRAQRGMRAALPLPRLEVRRRRQRRRHALGAAGRRAAPRQEDQGLPGAGGGRLRLDLDGRRGRRCASSSRPPGRRNPISATRSSRSTPRATGRRCSRARSTRRTARACIRPTCPRPRWRARRRPRARGCARRTTRRRACSSSRRATVFATPRSAGRSRNPETHQYVRTTLFIAPFTVLIPPNDQYNLAQMLVPIDDVNTMFYWIAWHPDPAKGITQEAWRAFCAAEVGVDLDANYRKKRNLAQPVPAGPGRHEARRLDRHQGHSRAGHGDVGIDGADHRPQRGALRLERSRGRAVQAHDGRRGEDSSGTAGRRSAPRSRASRT